MDYIDNLILKTKTSASKKEFINLNKEIKKILSDSTIPNEQKEKLKKDGLIDYIEIIAKISSKK